MATRSGRGDPKRGAVTWVATLLVWDAPNIDMTLSNIIDGKPTSDERPDLAVLGRWLVNRAGDGDEAEGAVFVNVAPHVAGVMRGWVLWLLDEGYRVFAKPKDGASDVDDDMLDHIDRRFEEGDLDAVYVGSNDAKAFIEPLEQLAHDGVAVHVLGFGEFSGGMAQNELLTFIDLEEISGLFTKPLPRLTLTNLPLDGQWFEPRGRLGSA